MLNKHSTTASLPLSAHQFGEGRWGGRDEMESGNRGRASVAMAQAGLELVMHCICLQC